MADRAVLFIDGNNWYHALSKAGVKDLGRLDYGKISQKLVGPRDWVSTRYYIGRVRQQGNLTLYSNQRAFLARLAATDSRISSHLGRLEPRTVKNEAASELQRYLSSLKTRIDPQVFQDLASLAKKHVSASVMVEKAVDVMVAVDMVVAAERDELDAAYLLSADGDFTPAVEAVRAAGKRVYAVSPSHGAQLGASVDSFIHLDPAWFGDCY